MDILIACSACHIVVMMGTTRRLFRAQVINPAGPMHVLGCALAGPKCSSRGCICPKHLPGHKHYQMHYKSNSIYVWFTTKLDGGRYALMVHMARDVHAPRDNLVPGPYAPENNRRVVPILIVVHICLLNRTHSLIEQTRVTRRLPRCVIGVGPRLVLILILTAALLS